MTADYGLTKPTYTVPETAAVLSICRAKLYELMKAKRIRYAKLDDRTLFFRDDIVAFLESLPRKG